MRKHLFCFGLFILFAATRPVLAQGNNPPAVSVSEMQNLKVERDAPARLLQSDRHLGLGVISNGATIGPFITYRFFKTWALHATGFAASKSGTDRTNPDVPHDYDYELRRDRKEIGLTKDFVIGDTTRWSLFAGGTVTQEMVSAKYTFYNIRNNGGFFGGTTRVDAGQAGAEKNQTYSSAIVGARLYETSRNLNLPFALTLFASLPLAGYEDDYSVRAPGGQKVDGKYSDAAQATFGLFLTAYVY